jgi:hypothetical protein
VTPDFYLDLDFTDEPGELDVVVLPPKARPESLCGEVFMNDALFVDERVHDFSFGWSELITAG